MRPQALQYLRRLCSHPLLALDPANPVHVAAATAATGTGTWRAAEARLHDLAHAPKLAALRDLLQQCSILHGEDAPSSSSTESEAAEPEGGHRVLVFAQLKAVLDLVEADVLGPARVPFLRLDGGWVPPACSRHWPPAHVCPHCQHRWGVHTEL